MAEISQSHLKILIVALLALLILGAEQALLGIYIAERSTNGTGFAASTNFGGTFFALHAIGAAVTILCSMLPILTAATTLIVRLALACLGAGLITLTLSNHWLADLCASFVMGLGFGGINLGFNGFIAQNFQKYRTLLLNKLNAAFGIGAVLAPSLLVFPSVTIGHVFAVSGTLALILLFGVSNLDSNTVTPGATLNRRVLQPIINWHHWAPAALVASLVFGLAVETSLIAWLPSTLRNWGMSNAQIAELMAHYFLYFLAARIVATVLSQRLSASLLVFTSVVGTAAVLGLVATGMVEQSSVAIAGGFIALLFPNLFGVTAEKLGNSQRGNAVLMLGGLTGAMVGPSLVGLLASVWPGVDLGNILALLSIGAALLVITVLAATKGFSLSQHQPSQRISMVDAKEA